MSDDFNRAKPVASGVEVKPLEWVTTSYGTPEVETVVGIYRLNHAYDGGWYALFKREPISKVDGRQNYPSVEEAKAAAEADYRNRIMSALLPKATAPVVSEPAAWIRPADIATLKARPTADVMVVGQKSGGFTTPLYAYLQPQPKAVTEERDDGN